MPDTTLEFYSNSTIFNKKKNRKITPLIVLMNGGITLLDKTYTGTPKALNLESYAKVASETDFTIKKT